jgi:dGTPase
MAMATALDHLGSWLDQPGVWILQPGPRHLAMLTGFCDTDVLRGALVNDAHIAALGIDSVERVRTAMRRPDGTPGPRIVAHAPEVTARKVELERFLFRRVYRSDRVLAVRVPAQRKLTALFEWYCRHPDQLPAAFRRRVDGVGIRRSVADYIAGMTDRYLDLDHDRRLAAGGTA